MVSTVFPLPLTTNGRRQHMRARRVRMRDHSDAGAGASFVDACVERILLLLSRAVAEDAETEALKRTVLVSSAACTPARDEREIEASACEVALEMAADLVFKLTPELILALACEPALEILAFELALILAQPIHANTGVIGAGGARIDRCVCVARNARMCSRTFAYELRFEASNTKMTACACENKSSRAGSKARDPPMSRNSTKKKEGGGDGDDKGDADDDDDDDEDKEECGAYECRVTSRAQPTVGPMAAEANEVESDGDDDDDEDADADAKSDVSYWSRHIF
jgi:hypothetical protein